MGRLRSRMLRNIRRKKNKKLRELFDFIEKINESKKLLKCPVCLERKLKIKMIFYYHNFMRQKGWQEAEFECDCGFQKKIVGKFMVNQYVAFGELERMLDKIVETQLGIEGAFKEVKNYE